ncbi:DNA excision repair protein Rad2 [Thermoascus aurantiacus ATCC 26904]
MGVTGLWTVVQPCARPIKLETLNKKRLAVDASIWIYQFLKAVRDKEGNALRNAHVVGFFRRICKLLYFGIKPVFVFDGGAPVLKRQTIAARKKRREGRREDAVRTAGKLLAIQMQRRAEEEEAKRKESRRQRQEEEVPDNPVYVDEAFMTEKEKRQNRQFRKKDAYHLPELEVSLEEMGAPNDPRIMSQEELEEYARQFHSGEDINIYDFSKIDFDSPFFQSLPATDRYNILNAARIRSRLRMGYSKEQLDSMFPDRMAFSKFQIERVKERNDLTQRLMNINGMNGDVLNSSQRIAGERGREYILVKDSEVEGGWALGVVGNKNEGQRDRPIDIDRYGQQDVFKATEDKSDDESDDLEDVPVEGLNRLPKLPVFQEGVFDEAIERHLQEIAEKRRAVYDARREAAVRQSHVEQNAEDGSLFVESSVAESQQKPQDANVDALFEEQDGSEDEDLRRAIKMSLESPKDDLVDEHPVDSASAQSLPKEHITGPVSESDDDEMDLTAALAKSKRSKGGPKPESAAPRFVAEHPFDGPLPFKPLKTRKASAAQNVQHTDTDENAGGFERESPRAPEKKPLPPWFSEGESFRKDFISEEIENDSVERYRDMTMTPRHQFLKDHTSPEVIDVDKFPDSKEVIDLEADEEAPAVQAAQKTDKSPIGVETDHPAVTTSSTAQPETSHTSGLTAKESEDEQVSLREQQSPSPEFEDVQMHPTNETPEVQSSSSMAVPAETEFEPETVDDQQEAFIEDDGHFSDPEDEDLMRQLAAEAEEHARFAASLNSKTPAETAIDYERELKQLRSQQKRDRRDADEVTQIMITECQQLLRLFGLPYITAPMEAEAQCAELVSLGLVDGIVTDDSDIFLFGGTRVYKNMFNQSKYVECYLASDLEEYALDRKKLIRFAHLLGSDYTEGIPGVGPVTALEILTEFSTLEEFRDWWTQVQKGVEMPDDPHAAFRKKFKKHISKLFLPPSFPDSRVDAAYLHPEVDSDPSPFQWGVPDLNGLRDFLMSTIGWSQERTDEILVPVIRDMNRREQEGTQSNITSFFSGPQGAGAFAPRVRPEGRSRMEKAFNRLRQEAEARKHQQQADPNEDGEKSADTDEEESNTKSNKRSKRRAPARKGRSSTSSADSDSKTKRRKTARGTE